MRRNKSSSGNNRISDSDEEDFVEIELRDIDKPNKNRRLDEDDAI